MIQKRTKEYTQKALEENRIIKETIRKSQLAASNEFELKKLTRQQEGFLNCSMEEEKESLIMTYDIQNLFPWAGIQHEKKELMLSALIDAGKLEKRAELYHFSLVPENLYFDIQGRVYVKTRDVYSVETGYLQEEFLREYKSLIGCTLLKKYKFEDYENGGQDLLAEDKFLSEILECGDVEQILEKLYDEYFRCRKLHRECFVEVSKAKNRGSKIALGITGVLAVACMAILGWQLIWVRPYEEAVIAANEAYLQSDYSGTVEAMKDVEVERMNVCQKYILAYSAVRCESFSDDSMKNILNTISLNGDEKIMEYWIYINRLDTEVAADIAMQESSNQLLYYAYLKEKAVIENDSSLSGQEKNERLSEIETKLQPLEEEFSTLTEE